MFFYIFLIFFIFLEKISNSIRLLVTLSIFLIIVPILLFFLLTLFTEKYINFNSDRLLYGFALTFEITVLMNPFINELYHKNIKYLNEIYLTIDWKVNRIDFFRNGLFILSLIPFIIEPHIENDGSCRCCYKILINYK